MGLWSTTAHQVSLPLMLLFLIITQLQGQIGAHPTYGLVSTPELADLKVEHQGLWRWLGCPTSSSP